MLTITRPFVDRLADAEWAFVAEPAYITRTRFGEFVNHPLFRMLREVHQLFDCRCSPGNVKALLSDVEALYADTQLPYRAIATSDATTAAALGKALPWHGWVEQPAIHVMVHADISRRETNSALRILELSNDTKRDWENLIACEHRPHPSPGFYEQYAAFASTQDVRFSTRIYLGFLDGVLAGTTGYHLVNGIARCRSVITRASCRGRGVASTLIHHVQSQPEVRAADALTIAVGHSGPRSLYEALGFRSATTVRRFFK